MKMRVKLGDVCNFYAGTGFPVAYQGKDSGELPFYKVGDIANNVSVGKTYLELCNNYISKEDARAIKGVIVPKGTVVFAKIGEALKLNRRAITSCDCLIDNNAMGIAPISDFLKEKYFFYYMKHLKMQELAESTTVPSVRKSKLEKTVIEVPSILEQQRIEKELDKISDIVSMRKQQLQQLDELVKARFVELFGDPMTNSKEYPLKKYGDLFELNAGGTPSKQKPEYWDNGTISWIGSNMCQNSVIYENDGNYITEEGFNHSSARMFPVDTVLIALVGATIGKTALLKFETTTNQNVLGVRGIRESGFTPEFVFYYTQGLYQKFLDIGDGGFAMASKGFISELPIPIVDLSRQNEFADFVEQVNKSKFVVQKALNEAQTLFDSLMQEYFG